MGHTSDSDLIEKLENKQVPSYAVFEITQKCNLQCIHCYVNRYPRGEELSLNEIFSLIQEFADCGMTYNLELTGGEPLMHKHFFEIAEHVRKLGFYTRILTNATLITEEIADRIAALSPYRIAVTLYGHNESIYKKISGRPGMFRAAIAGLRALSTRKLPVKVSPPPFFNFLSIQDIKKIHRIIDDFGFERDQGPVFYFSPKNNVGGLEPLKYNITDEVQYEACFKEFPGRPIKLFPLQRNLNKGVCEYRRQRTASIFINAYGQVGNCPYVQSKESIREKPVLDIWRNDPILKGIRELTWKEMSECLDCESRQFCKPCPGYNFCVNKTLTKPVEAWCKRVGLEKRIYEKHGLKKD